MIYAFVFRLLLLVVFVVLPLVALAQAAADPEAASTETLVANLLSSEAGVALFVGLFGHLVLSVVNAVFPNEGANAGPIARAAGKLIRAGSLTVNEAVSKKLQA